MISQRSREQQLKVGKFDLGMSARWLESQVRHTARRGALSPRESALAERIKLLKREAGSHSPSAPTLARMIPELRLRVDACFLSNPYATDLFLDYFHREVIRTGKLRRLLEFYPSQNRVIADKLSGTVGVPTEYLFVGNGAVEIIQAILHRFTGAKILVNLPTFSPYHEFVRSDTQVLYNVLPKENDFRFDPNPYLELVRREKPDTVVLINPNNPDGGYIPYATLVHLLEELRHVPNVILDESFIHFACEGDDYAYRSLSGEVDRFPNLMVVKSMSKDFGVAGIRAGYAVMAPQRVQSLLNNGYLWNSSGLAEYFFDLYSRPDFLIEYERKRVHYIRHSRRFFKALSLMPGLHAYPTCANFVLIELRNEMTAEDLVCRLLVRRGIYTRTCDDKKGLEPGKFIRVASRCRSENRFVLRLPRYSAVNACSKRRERARRRVIILPFFRGSMRAVVRPAALSPRVPARLRQGAGSDLGIAEREPVMIEPQQLQDGRMEVAGVHWVLGDVVRELVGLTDECFVRLSLVQCFRLRGCRPNSPAKDVVFVSARADATTAINRPRRRERSVSGPTSRSVRASTSDFPGRSG